MQGGHDARAGQLERSPTCRRATSPRATRTSVNTEQIGGYTLFNAYLDVGQGFDFGYLKEVKLRFNVDNITDKQYLGTITSTIDTPATFRPGSHRTFQVSLTAQL